MKKSKGKTILYIPIITIMCICISCTNNKNKPSTTSTSGSTKIVADESLRPLIHEEMEAFHAIYKRAHIQATYTSEGKAIEDLLNDRVKVIAVTRRLTAVELKILKDKKINVKQLSIAKEGVAVILNKKNIDTLLHLNQLKKILQGDITHWSQLNTNRANEIEIVFDNPNSGIIRYLKDTLFKISALSPNCYAQQNSKEVISHVVSKKNAIGFIGTSWISDRDDSVTTKFIESLCIASVSNDTIFYQPYQAYIALNKYPLTREIILISREARAGLGNGFVSFVAGDKGQRIALKAGLVPMTMPIRIIEVNHEPLF